MSKISNEGLEQIQVIKNALDSMFDKLDTTVYKKDGTKYKSHKVFDDVRQEFEAIAGIVSTTNEWERI